MLVPLLLAAACTSHATPVDGVVGATPDASDSAQPTAPAMLEPPLRSPLALTVATGGPPGALVGIEAARIVVEYPVAADRTGLLALVDTPADVVGPLRSATPSDATLALAFGADLVTSVTAGSIVDDLTRAHLAVVEEHTVTGALVRDPARRAPFNLYAVPEVIRNTVASASEPVAGPAVLPWTPDPRVGGQPDLKQRSGASPTDVKQRSGASPTGEVAVQMADEIEVTWTWDPGAGQWLRTVNGELEQTATGERVAATTVVVLEVPPTADRPPVVADLAGRGIATILREGQVVEARWQRSGDAALPTVTGGGYAPRSSTWVQLRACDSGRGKVC